MQGRYTSAIEGAANFVTQQLQGCSPNPKLIKRAIMKFTSTKRIALIVSAGVLGLQLSVASAADDFSPYVDKKGNISLPDDFRLKMIHLGSWFVAEGGASGFHDVYTEAATAEAYRESGAFPDGATLVKELRAHETGKYTTGDAVSRATDGLKQWFVMIKDSEGRFPDNAVWGDGWGWALFKTTDTGVNAASDYKADCLGCHVPAQETDWIYIEGYPTLTATK